MIKEMRKKKGFSLVELIVVIAIIGILAAIAVPKYSQYQQGAKIRADKSTAKMIADATLMAVESGEITEKQAEQFDSTINGDGDASAIWTKVSNYITGGAEIQSVGTPSKWEITMSSNIISVKLIGPGVDSNDEPVANVEAFEVQLEY